MPYAHITGWGMAVPEKVLTNHDLEKMVDTSDEWIVERTGIRERHIAGEHQFPSTLGVDAALKALKIANLKPTEIDLIICASSSPEYIFPATACLIQDRLGATRAGAFDLSAACSGFVYGLQMATQSIRSGSIRTALVVGAETLSRFTDYTDRNTCILFGDGAGAFVLQASEEPGGVLSGLLRSDGSGADLLAIDAGCAHLPASEATLRDRRHYIHMDGREVFKFAARVMAQATREVSESAGLSLEQIDWVVPHQANIRIIEAAAKGLKLPRERFVVNVDRYGNTSTASIPIATCESIDQGQIKPGDKLVMVGFGGGLTWGAVTVHWTGPLPAKGKVHPEWYVWLGRIVSFFNRIRRQIESWFVGRNG